MAEDDAPRRRHSDGAAPEELMAEIDSEVHHLRLRQVEDRQEWRLKWAEVDGRLRDVEVTVGHLDRTLRWGLGIVSGAVVSGFGAVLALLLSRH